MKNLFSTRTVPVSTHGQALSVYVRVTFHAYDSSPSPIQTCHRRIVLDHGSLALMPSKETWSLPAAYVRTRIEYP